MIYGIFLSKEALKTLERIDRITEGRISDNLERLRIDPGGQGKQLKGFTGLRALRVGDWRVIYTIKEDPSAVCILAIRPRGRSYRTPPS